MAVTWELFEKGLPGAPGSQQISEQDSLLTGDFRVCLNPKSMQNNSPKPKITAIKAILLHTFGVQVGL